MKMLIKMKTNVTGLLMKLIFLANIVLKSFKTFKLNDQKQREICPITKNQARKKRNLHIIGCFLFLLKKVFQKINKKKLMEK